MLDALLCIVRSIFFVVEKQIMFIFSFHLKFSKAYGEKDSSFSRTKTHTKSRKQKDAGITHTHTHTREEHVEIAILVGLLRDHFVHRMELDLLLIKKSEALYLPKA